MLSVLSATNVVLGIPLSIASIGTRSSGCSVAGAQLNLPANQTAITVPSGSPIYIALGFGTQVCFSFISLWLKYVMTRLQNYTCGTTGTFASAGAVAQLFDLSCAVNTPVFSTVQDKVYNLGPTAQGQTLISNIGEYTLHRLRSFQLISRPQNRVGTENDPRPAG